VYSLLGDLKRGVGLLTIMFAMVGWVTAEVEVGRVSQYLKYI